MSGSVLALTYDTSTGRWLAGLIEAAQVGPGAITSGKLGSGAIGSLSLIADGLFTADAAGRGKFANAFVNNSLVATDIDASKLGAGLLPHARISGLPYANLNLTNSIVTGDIVDNAIETAKINDGAVTATKIGAAAVGSGLIADYGILSGKYASGSITENVLASGISIDIAETLSDPTFRAGEIISAYQCVTIQSGLSKYVLGAKADDANLMPAVGIVTANVASGSLGVIHLFGRTAYDAGRISGYVGEPLFVGTDGYLCKDGDPNFPDASGNISQRLGEVANNDVIDLKPSPVFIEIVE